MDVSFTKLHSHKEDFQLLQDLQILLLAANKIIHL